MASDAVAAGDGALTTWTQRPERTISKSSRRVPSGLIAWARTPAPAGTRSSAFTSGTRRCRAATIFEGRSDRTISSAPVRQCLAANLQLDGRAANRAVSTGRKRVHE